MTSIFHAIIVEKQPIKHDILTHCLTCTFRHMSQYNSFPLVWRGVTEHRREHPVYARSRNNSRESSIDRSNKDAPTPGDKWECDTCKKNNFVNKDDQLLSCEYCGSYRYLSSYTSSPSKLSIMRRDACVRIKKKKLK